MEWTATAPGGAWQVRVDATDGTATGAGFVISHRHVLTAAHVVDARRSSSSVHGRRAVLVEQVGRPAAPVRLATVVPGGWFPVGEGGGADLALLELEAPVPAPGTPPLCRLAPTRGRPVLIAGQPIEAGVGTRGTWARATLAGAGGGEWVALDLIDPGLIGAAGFRGAAVVDEASGSIIGMAVGDTIGREPPGWWMLPVESMLRHLGRRPGVHGPPAIDPALAEAALDDVVDLDTVRPLARWFGGGNGGTRPVRLVATADGAHGAERDGTDDDRTGPGEGPARRPTTTAARPLPATRRDLDRVSRPALVRVVVLADRELRPPRDHPVILDAPSGTVPAVGSVDLAVDVADRTVDEVTGRIAERFGVEGPDPATVIERLGGAAGATVVIVGVDEAADPPALIEGLLAPLADAGLRLLLTFGRPWSPAWELAQERWPDHDLDDDDPTVVAERLEALAARIDDVARREDALLRRRTSVALRIAVVPGLPPRAMALRLRFTALDKTARGPDWSWLLPQLEGCETAVARVAERLDTLEAALDALLDQRAALQSQVADDRWRAERAGIARDRDLDRLHRQADETLARAPCDLAEAADLAARYRRALDERLS